MALFTLARPLFAVAGPERAHTLTIAALRAGLHPKARRPDDPILATRAFGMAFPNPLGIAAGFDKNAEVPDAMLAMGFGFAEVGTVTPQPQAGNPKPRIFRLRRQRAVINRLGFNNEGHAAVRARLVRRRGRGGIVGVNIGANKDSADRIADYLAGLTAFHTLADYFTINVSSPNTPGLRDLQRGDDLDQLLARIAEHRRPLGEVSRRQIPVLLKIAPDVTDTQLEHIAWSCLDHAVDGVIVSNTTIARDGVSGRHAGEAGGLSGPPLFARSTRLLARLHRLTDGRLPLVGVGGIASADDAYVKITAGASVLQLYTALTYQGPALIGRIKQGLARRLRAEGFTALDEAVGTAAHKLS